jgi:hypothetical protein
MDDAAGQAPDGDQVLVHHPMPGIKGDDHEVLPLLIPEAQTVGVEDLAGSAEGLAAEDRLAVLEPLRQLEGGAELSCPGRRQAGLSQLMLRHPAKIT